MPRACGTRAVLVRRCLARWLSVALSTRSLSLPFLTLSLSATLRIRAPRRAVPSTRGYFLSLFSRVLSPPPRSPRVPITSRVRSFSPSRAPSSVPSFLIPPSSRVYSFHRCFRPLILLVARSPSFSYFFLRFLSRAVSPFCSVSFFFCFCLSFASRLSLSRSQCRLFFAVILSSPNIRHQFSFFIPLPLYSRPTDFLAHRGFLSYDTRLRRSPLFRRNAVNRNIAKR